MSLREWWWQCAIILGENQSLKLTLYLIYLKQVIKELRKLFPVRKKDKKKKEA